MANETEFQEFPKIARLSREIIITEKIDGTNAQVYVGEDGEVRAGSRTRWITPQADNYGFAAWVEAHKDELRQLGPGRHFGEWWGLGIQRNYGAPDKRFSLFNVGRWRDSDPGWPDVYVEAHPDLVRAPACCRVVPVLGVLSRFDSGFVDEILGDLQRKGSVAAPGFMKPEGIVIFHPASRTLFKKTIERDEEPKSKRAEAA